MYKIKDVYKFKSIMDSKEYLFGTVVKHYKYEEDHHIITSEVVEFDSKKLIAKTKSGSIYEIENIFKTRKEFEDFIDINFGDKVCGKFGFETYADYYKYITN